MTMKEFLECVLFASLPQKGLLTLFHPDLLPWGGLSKTSKLILALSTVFYPDRSCVQEIYQYIGTACLP